MKMILAVLALVVLAVVGWFAYDRDGFWIRFFGPADLGPADFKTLRKTDRPNQFLVCPAGYCASEGSDMPAPVFKADAAQLKHAVTGLIEKMPDAQMVENGGEIRAVVRTKLMRYPDTVSIHVLDAGDGLSTLAIYSRSQIGRSDFGVNGARVASWIRRLADMHPIAKPSSTD